MGEPGHLVARSTIEIVAFDRLEAETLSRRTSAAAPALAAAIERVLDAHDPGDRRIRLDVVELDLARCDPARWEAALIAGIERALGARLRAALAAADENDAEAGGTRALELLATFARWGRLPWWGRPTDTPGTAVAHLDPKRVAPEAVRRLLAAPGAIERLVFQLDDGALATLARLSEAPRAVDLAGAAVRLAARIERQAAGDAGARVGAWREALGRAARGEPAAPPARRPAPDAPVPSRARPRNTPLAGAGATATGLAPPPPGAAPAGERTRGSVAAPEGAATAAAAAAPAALAARLAAEARQRPAWSALLAHLAGLAPALDPLAAAEALRACGPGASLDAVSLTGLIEVFVAAGRVQRADAARWTQAVRADEAMADPHDAIAVDDAGLPLVWPFLPAFFANLGLLADGGFRDVSARHRAVCLARFLASGERAPAEPQLPLAKLLAGVDLEAVHEPGAPLSEGEAQAGDALLAAVIAQAPMLGRISVDGLRGSFLLRPGSLTTRDGHWLLRVERRSYDLLLDRLPWPLRWARLPWMEAPLQVEW